MSIWQKHWPTVKFLSYMCRNLISSINLGCGPNRHFDLSSKWRRTGQYRSHTIVKNGQKMQYLTSIFFLGGGLFKNSMCTIKGLMGTALIKMYTMGYLQCIGCLRRRIWCSIQYHEYIGCTVQCTFQGHTFYMFRHV